MRPRILTFAFLLLALLTFGLLASGCGEEAETEVMEGEPLELGDLHYNVQITRFLNPSSDEDAAYLQGAPPLEKGQQYLAVFMQIENTGDEDAVVPFPFEIVDTRDERYTQDRVDNDFALVPDTPIPADGTVPGLEDPARTGPVEGSMILFRIDEAATENRPLKLEVVNGDESGEIELDL